MKQALTDGSVAAVAQLGAEGGFLNNPKVRIPLPPALQRIETALRYTGMKRQADELVVAMNRAAAGREHVVFGHGERKCESMKRPFGPCRRVRPGIAHAAAIPAPAAARGTR